MCVTTSVIAMPHEIEQHLQLGPIITPAAADLLGADHFAAGCLQGGMLSAEVWRASSKPLFQLGPPSAQLN
jgi:hypothetical protein